MRRKIIIIHEDNHGVIGVAKNYKRALKFLKEKRWFDEIDMEALYGENWFQVFRQWKLNKFNDELEGWYHLEVIELY